ncbi:TetR/AcrR family transcriptional regulator [Nocardioides sp. LHD-245]|uniref:TetR/AcrR family transcriptional regulator n=1 Tax=Nocardioides sp. LHD-245 TaxID=3051387 RepID=UPI0027DF9823|nr:TetR/AcrR family transcriptional regulator [Nocardioides sp. LHD-245]
MARPKGQQRNSRDVLVAAAVENFTALGYHGTSMRDIARTAGVTVASIYHHFPSKQDILQHVMLGTITDVLAATRTAVAEAVAEGRTGPTERLEAVVDAWVVFHTTRQAEALIGASEIRSLDEAGRAALVAHRDEQEALFREIIEDGVRDGAFATGYPREAARAIIEMGSSISSWYRLGGELSPEEMSVRYRELARGTVVDTSLTATGSSGARASRRRR